MFKGRVTDKGIPYLKEFSFIRFLSWYIIVYHNKILCMKAFPHCFLSRGGLLSVPGTRDHWRLSYSVLTYLGGLSIVGDLTC